MQEGSSTLGRWSELRKKGNEASQEAVLLHFLRLASALSFWLLPVIELKEEIVFPPPTLVLVSV